MTLTTTLHLMTGSEDYLNLPFQQVLESKAGTGYRVLQLLGRGGSAETYLVLASSGPLQGQVFALKVFRRLSRPEWRDTFLKEVAFLQQQDHPAVMRVYDEGLFQNVHPFVVAEYLPRTLAAVLLSSPSIMERLSYTLQLLSALSYLASRSPPVVHRDIKPENIFIKGGSCVLGDFGLVKPYLPAAEGKTDAPLLQASQRPGMPRWYRTPDLVAYLKTGTPPTPQSDLFQLGLVLAEMFTGRNPQKPLKEGEDFTVPVELEPLGSVPGGLGEGIADLIRPMLTLEPSGRPALADLLSAWQSLFLEAAKRSHALEGRVL